MVKRAVAFVGMVVGSSVCGFIVGVIAILVGAAVLRGDLAGFGTLAGALMGIVIGYPIGVIIGIVVIYKLFHRKGSPKLGMLGSILGAVVTIGLAEPLNLNQNTDLLFVSFFLASPLLGTIGFHLKIKKGK